MAEALAIAAAAVQFMDISLRLVGMLSRLCTDLRHVPREIQDTDQELREFVQLVKILEYDICTANTGPASTLNGAQAPVYAISLLNQCITQAQQLENPLQPLMVKVSDHAIRRGWRAVVSLNMEKEILQRWTRLQGLKGSLSLWYSHESLILLKDQV